MVALPLVALDVLVIALWTIAAALAIALIMDKLGGILSGVPWIGGKLSDAATRMAQAITNACGSMLSGIDHLIGAAWSHLAHYIEGLFSQFVAHSSLIAHLARLVGDGLYRITGLRALVHSLSKAVHVVLHRFVAIGREIDHLRQRVKRLEHEVGQGIGDDVLPRIKTLEREIGHVTSDVIPAIEAADAQAESAIGDLWSWVKNNALVAGTAAFAGAVAIALADLGLGWLRCDSNPFNNNKNACGLWGDLSQLLGVLATVIAVEDFEQLVREMQRAEQGVAEGLHDLFNL